MATLFSALKPMTYWNYGVYADKEHGTVCYAASVCAPTEREAIAALRVELRRIPMPLYIGPLQEAGAKQKSAYAGDIQMTESNEVRLVRIDR